MIRFAWYAAVALLTVAALVLLWGVREAIALFLLSLAVAAAFRPGVRLLVRRGLPRIPALFAVYLSVVAVVAALLVLASGPLVRDLHSFVEDVTLGYEQAVTEWPESGTSLQRTIAGQLPPLSDLLEVLTGPEGAALAQQVFGAASGFFDLAGNLGLVLILSLYWSVDQTRFERLWLSLVPVTRRSIVRDVWREAEGCVGAYIRSEFTLSLIAGLTLSMGYAGLGAPYAAVLGLFGALARLIPWVGPLLAVLPAALLAWTVGPVQAVLVIVLGLGLLYALDLVLRPRILCREHYSALVLAVVLVAMAHAGGLLGVLLAPLVAVTIQVLVLGARRAPNAAAVPAGGIADLHERLERLKERVAREEQPPPPEVVNLLQRLDALLARASRR
ncbi:MAG: AI-2E family transporter [Anaerolineae bacterium]